MLGERGAAEKCYAAMGLYFQQKVGDCPLSKGSLHHPFRSTTDQYVRMFLHQYYMCSTDSRDKRK